MSDTSRFLLSYSWIVIGITVVVALMFLAPTVGTVSQPLADVVCAPYNPEECPQPSSRRKLSQTELDTIVQHHQEWLALDPKGRDAHPNLWADLRGYDLQGLSLVRKDLRYADLSGAAIGPIATQLNGTDLEQAKLICTDLRRADLSSVGLKGAHLEWARLCNAYFDETHLEGAILFGANLTDAALERAKMGGSYMDFTNLSRTHFEIDPDSLPVPSSLVYATNLLGLVFEENPASLAKLRDELKALGLSEQQKQLTAAIRRAEMLRRDRENKDNFVHGNAERAFNQIAA